MFKKILILGITVAVLGAVGYHYSHRSLEVVPVEDTLVVGTQLGYPPYEMQDARGNPIGFDIDLANLIGKALGKKVVIKDMSLDALILSLQQGKIDMIMAGLSITNRRLKAIAMVPYHGEPITHLTLVFWEKVPEGVTTFKDLQGKVVAVMAGSFQEEYLNKQAGIVPKALDATTELLIDIRYGKSQAALLEPHIAETMKLKFNQLKTIDIQLAPEDQVLGSGIGIRKNDTILFRQVEAVVNELKASGQLKELHQKWFEGGEKW